MLGEIVDAIAATGEALRLYRIAEAERQRLEAERARREYELRQLREQELDLRRTLDQQAVCWEKAAQLRAFANACETRLKSQGTTVQDSSTKLWLDWVRRCAEELDPLNGNYLQRAIRSLPEQMIKLGAPE
jgi:hypothetical protein